MLDSVGEISEVRRLVKKIRFFGALHLLNDKKGKKFGMTEKSNVIPNLKGEES